MKIFGYEITIKKIEPLQPSEPDSIRALTLDDWIRNNSHSNIMIFSPVGYDQERRVRVSIRTTQSGSLVETDGFIKANTVHEGFYAAVRLIERTIGTDWRRDLPVVILDKSSKGA